MSIITDFTNGIESEHDRTIGDTGVRAINMLVDFGLTREKAREWWHECAPISEKAKATKAMTISFTKEVDGSWSAGDIAVGAHGHGPTVKEALRNYALFLVDQLGDGKQAEVCQHCKHWELDPLAYSLDVGTCEAAAPDVRRMEKVSMAIMCGHDGPIYTSAKFGCVLFEGEEGK